MLIAALAAASHPTSHSISGEICRVGAVALNDLSSIGKNPGYQRFYGDFKPDQPDLLKSCPRLRRLLPKQYPPADADAIARAREGSPDPAHVSRPAMVYSIGVPEISPDGKTAKVRFGYFCTGLCGAYYVGHYVRTHRGWVRDSGLQLMMVS